MPLFVEIPFQKLCEIDTLAEWHLQILFSFCVHQHTIDRFSRASPSRPVFLRLRLVTRFPALTAGCMLPRAFQK